MCLFSSLNIYGAPVPRIAPSSGDVGRSQSCPQGAQGLPGRSDCGLVTISLIQVPTGAGGTGRPFMQVGRRGALKVTVVPGLKQRSRDGLVRGCNRPQTGLPMEGLWGGRWAGEKGGTLSPNSAKRDSGSGERFSSWKGWGAWAGWAAARLLPSPGAPALALLGGSHLPPLLVTSNGRTQ